MNKPPDVKTDYQLPDNLPFTGQLLQDQKRVQAIRLGACEIYLVTCVRIGIEATSAPRSLLCDGGCSSAALMWSWLGCVPQVRG